MAKNILNGHINGIPAIKRQDTSDFMKLNTMGSLDDVNSTVLITLPNIDDKSEIK
jgi:hypothetical protein